MTFYAFFDGKRFNTNAFQIKFPLLQTSFCTEREKTKTKNHSEYDKMLGQLKTKTIHTSVNVHIGNADFAHSIFNALSISHIFPSQIFLSIFGLSEIARIILNVI